MSKGFHGPTSTSLDGKHRLTLPSRHREMVLAESEGKLTITRHPDGYLMLFTQPEWEKFSERVALLPNSHQWLRRIFLGSAMDVELDSTGRVLIAQELREAVGITREPVSLVGMRNHLEIWDKATLDAKEAKARAEGKCEVPEDFTT